MDLGFWPRARCVAAVSAVERRAANGAPFACGSLSAELVESNSNAKGIRLRVRRPSCWAKSWRVSTADTRRRWSPYGSRRDPVDVTLDERAMRGLVRAAACSSQGRPGRGTPSIVTRFVDIVQTAQASTRSRAVERLRLCLGSIRILRDACSGDGALELSRPAEIALIMERTPPLEIVTEAVRLASSRGCQEPSFHDRKSAQFKFELPRAAAKSTSGGRRGRRRYGGRTRFAENPAAHAMEGPRRTAGRGRFPC